MFPFKQICFCTLRSLRMSLGRFFMVVHVGAGNTRTRNPFCHPLSVNHLLSVNQRPRIKKSKHSLNNKQADSKSTTWIEMKDSVCLHHIDDVLKQVCSVRWNHLGFVTWQQSFLCFDATPFAQDEIYLVTWFCIIFFPHVFPSPIKTPGRIFQAIVLQTKFHPEKKKQTPWCTKQIICTECAGLLRLRGRHYGRIGPIGTPRLYGFQPSGFHSRRVAMLSALVSPWHHDVHGG